MDFESGFPESVEDNEDITTPDKLDNRSCDGVVVDDDDKLLENGKGNEIEVTEYVNLLVKSVSPLGTTKKGHRLKKWRRIKINKDDGDNNLDSSMLLKRGLSNSFVNLTKTMHFSMQKSVWSSVSSTNAMVGSLRPEVDGFVMLGNIRLGFGPTFRAMTDSENSKDRSSKSSAVSLKTRYEKPVVVVGYARNKNGIRSLSGKNSGNLFQQWKGGQIESIKKPRGDMVKIEKENSHSRMESDSSCSNFVFMQGTDSATSNARQSGKSMNQDGDNSDEDHGCEPQFSQETGGYDRKEAGEFEDVSQEDLAADLAWEAVGEKRENHGSSSDQDTLVESILSLQSVQEAFEKEVQKWKDIGKEDNSVIEVSNLSAKTTYDNPEVHERCSSDPLQFGKSGQGSRHSFETQVTSLKQRVDSLEGKLEEERAMLKMKEAKIVELEATLDSNKFTQEESGSTIELGLQQENYREMEIEVEGLFRQKIEAEVQYLAISRTIQNLRVAAMEVLEKQKTLALDQAQMLGKLGDAEGKAVMLKRQAKKLETCCEDIVGADEVRIWKFTLYLFIQLILLLVILRLFKFSSLDAGVIPT